MNMQKPLDDVARRNGWWVVAGFVGLVAGVYLLPLSPLNDAPLCPFRHLTGYSCPGCGMTRACVSLAHGDLGASFYYHPLAGLLVLAFGAYAMIRLLDNLKGYRFDFPGRAWGRANTRRLAVASLALVVGFGAIRLFLELIGFLTPV